MNIHNILIFDANQRSALAATRALGKLTKLQIFTTDSSASSLAGSSKYSRAYFTLPDAATHPKLFLEKLSALIESENIGFLLPVTEITSRLMLENTDMLSGCVLPFSDYETVLSISDKQQLMQAAQAQNIPVPNTYYFSSLSEWEHKEWQDFPLVIKPALSRLCIDGKWIGTTVRIVKDREALEAFLITDQYLNTSPFMVQEYIAGHGEGVFALYKNGEPICHFSHQRIREKPPQGGVSVLSRAIPVRAELQQYADKLLNACQWSGVAMIEFRVSENGTPYLMEINTRFWGSLQLSIDAGVNFPVLLYSLFTDTTTPKAVNYQSGVQLRWYLGDLDNLYLYLRNNSYSLKEKLKHICNFLSYHRNTRHEILRFDDWQPALYEAKSYLKAIVGK